MARIVSVYRQDLRPGDRPSGELRPTNMGYIRWLRVAEALATLGHEVHLAMPEGGVLGEEARSVCRGVRAVPLRLVDWSRYDVVKTVRHRGYETLESCGGIGHPFVVSDVGSVVGPEDREGIWFCGGVRAKLFETQERIVRTSRYVTVLNEQARDLLHECHGRRDGILCVAGAADRHIPVPDEDPFPPRRAGRRRVLFAGTVHTEARHPEANRTLVGKLNCLGKLLKTRNADLYMIGDGDLSLLDTESVHWLGVQAHHRSWQYLRHADIGVVVAAGRMHHNSESTKLYHYLRVGLPVVAESGFPNEYLVQESALGVVVGAGDMRRMADAIEWVARRTWDRRAAIDYIIRNHTWDERVRCYHTLLAPEFGEPAGRETPREVEL